MGVPKLQPGDVLLIVDVQNDFCPGGALPVPAGDEVIPVLNRWIQAAADQGVPVIASRDWHPAGHTSFREAEGPWPPHCVQSTRGAEMHPDLQLPEGAQIVSKGKHSHQDVYSAFDGTGLAELLTKTGANRLWVGGLAQEYCVRATVLDACAAGYEVHVIQAATRPMEEDKGRAALKEMQTAGAVVETGE